MEDMKTFRNFDVVSDYSDHHFLNKNQNRLGNTKSSVVHKSIMKEWKILEQNLPDSIYVRVYEGRIDLMRVAIIGAAVTPYHDGLFFFDIAFPSNYPDNPPMVRFISFGLQINQYINPDGELCLSLLKTWGWFSTGNKSEKWNPSVSTCLQLLLSIQALILVEKPIYVWPSYLLHEDIYGRTCQLALRLLKRPPKNFESFIKDHFRDRAAAILTAFIEYANGRVAIGYYGARAQSCSPPPEISVSQKYKNWAQKFYPLMINVFEQCGASLDTSIARSLVLLSESKSKNNTILTKVMAHIKVMFGM